MIKYKKDHTYCRGPTPIKGYCLEGVTENTITDRLDRLFETWNAGLPICTYSTQPVWRRCVECTSDNRPRDSLDTADTGVRNPIPGNISGTIWLCRSLNISYATPRFPPWTSICCQSRDWIFSTRTGEENRKPGGLNQTCRSPQNFTAANQQRGWGMPVCEKITSNQTSFNY